MRRMKSWGAGVGAAVLLAGALQAGDESVDPVQPIFVPDPVFVAPSFDAPASLPVPAATAAVAAATASGVLSAAGTTEIVDAVETGVQFCLQLQRGEYSVDCLAYQLWQVQEALPASGDYAEVKATLADTADRLQALARDNRSRELPRGRASTSQQVTTRPLTPVATDRLASVNAQALAIVEEAETILLRSAQASEDRRLPFQRISAAVGSSKILLRST